MRVSVTRHTTLARDTVPRGWTPHNPDTSIQVLVNLIPYNENGLGLPGASEGELFHAPRAEDVYAFQVRVRV